jgi:hypothetical protein
LGRVVTRCVRERCDALARWLGRTTARSSRGSPTGSCTLVRAAFFIGSSRERTAVDLPRRVALAARPPVAAGPADALVLVVELLAHRHALHRERDHSHDASQLSPAPTRTATALRDEGIAQTPNPSSIPAIRVVKLEGLDALASARHQQRIRSDAASKLAAATEASLLLPRFSKKDA